jgi:hypothetical protein
VTQAAGGLALQSLTALFLGFAGLGRFALLYGTIVLLTALVSGFVGDSLTVLDRNHPLVRAALEGWALVLILAVSAGVGLAGILAGVVSPLEGALFALAAAAFLAEDLIRRLLMAEFRFWRITAMDAVAAAVCVAALLLVGPASTTLAIVLGALALGQASGLVAGIVALPRGQRYVVRLTTGGFGHVARFGAWRAAQQALRPSLLTVLRTAVILTAGYAAAGGLEAARIYVAPTMLLIGGVSSYLFADYSRRGTTPLTALVRRADRSVLLLFAVTAVIGGIALVVLPLAGPVLVGRGIDAIAVVGWLAYAATIAAVTPYGTLASVRGSQSLVFLARLGDSILSLVAVLVLFELGGAVPLAPIFLAVGSLAGGTFIRLWILSPRVSPSPVLSPSSSFPFGSSLSLKSSSLSIKGDVSHAHTS